MEQPELFRLTLPARYRYLKLIGDCIDLLLGNLQPQPGKEQVIYGVKLAVHEIANNIIEHAYGHEQGELAVILQIDWQAHCFRATLHDTGSAFAPTAVTAPNLDEPQESGYGLFLAQQLMDEVRYTRQADGNHWHLIKNLPES